ncbi:MAG TPA: TlpA disulfide reductase family protein [Terriglobia bacterium]|nr:TlpA disulfide reductase family protein [Terriglobia bacterium]
MPALSAGMTAPQFKLATTTGGRCSLSEAIARGPVLLAFFKVSCPTCQFTLPFLERLHEQLGAEGVQTWGIVQDKAQDGARFAATFGLTFPILIDDSPYKVSRAYGLTHVPSIFLVKPGGSIEISSEGFCKADLLAVQSTLAKMVSSTPPALFLPTERIPEYKPG